ncbi:MAG: hypothetical protein ACK5Q5_01560 [Planctomycetaceae bacterium]
MSTMTEPPRSAPPRDSQSAERPPEMLPDGRANVSLLEDKLPDYLKATKSLAVLTAVIGVIFFALNRLAIRLTDVWGHLAYGRWMQAHDAIPQTEPLMNLSQGVPWVDTAWLSKVGGAWTIETCGVPGLQMMHAVTLTIGFALLAWLIYRRTQSLGWTLTGVLLFGAVDYTQLLIQRPQDFGVAAFACVLTWGLTATDRRWTWIALPAMFALWANLHGSFAVGLVALGAVAVGRGIDVWRKTHRFTLALRSGYVWRGVLMLELCAAAVLLNPAGLKIYADVLSIATNENLKVLFDWTPLTIRMGQGQMFVVAVVVLAAAFRMSPRRVTAVELLLLVGFGIASLWSLRMVIWFGPVAAYCLGVHGAAAWRARRRSPLVAAPAERRGLWTITTIGLAWIFFAYTPFGLQRLHGRPTGKEALADFRRSVIDRTPLSAVAYLEKHADELPGGQMYNSHEWGDYLQWAGPQKFKVFVSSHVHLIPTEVWKDYLQIAEGAGDWQDKLNRYQVNTVLVDSTNYMGLIRALRDEAAWKEVYSDPQGLAVLFVRKHPI